MVNFCCFFIQKQHFRTQLLNLLSIQTVSVRKLYFLLFIIFTTVLSVNAQSVISINSQKDSLVSLLNKSSNDTNRVHLLYQLSLILNRDNIPENLLYHTSDAFAFSQKEHYQWGIGVSSYLFSFYYYIKRDYSHALDYILKATTAFKLLADKENFGRCLYLKANILFDKGDYTGSIENCKNALQNWGSIGFKKLRGACCNDLALSYARMGNYSSGVEFAYKAFKASEEISDKKEMAQSLHLMGAMYYEFKNYENALKNFMAASLIYQELDNTFGYARNNNMIGEILLEQGNYYQAQLKFEASLAIYKQPNAPLWGLPWGLSNIGSVFEKRGDSAAEKRNISFANANYYHALNNYLFSLKKFEEINDPAGAAEQAIYIGKMYFKLGNFSNAKQYLEKGLDMANKVGEKKNLTSCYLFLSKTDSAEGNVAKAYEHHKLYVLYKDSIFNIESTQNLSMYKNQLEMEKKDHEITLLASENKLQTVLAEKESQKRNFAYVVLCLTFITVAYAFFRFKKQSKIKSEKNILNERLAISQDLHDNIGSTLSSISIYSQVAKIHGDRNEQKDMSNLLEKISSASVEMVDEMNDIVWALNPRNDSIAKIIERMESFAKPLAVAKNIHFNLNFEQALLTLALDMNKRKNFYLIFKEAINNAIKYSGASELNASILKVENYVTLKVADNGVGFDTDITKKNKASSLSGNGLQNMYKRAYELKGDLQIISNIGEGTKIILHFPVI